METRDKIYHYSEIFKSFQGEGHYCGVPTMWYRTWGCNFECAGFSQPDPLDKSTWQLDYLDIDPTNYKTMDELPVFKRGCDSSYSWSKKFKHLARNGTAGMIAAQITNLMYSKSNPQGKFQHPISGQWSHMAFTGGEPMMSQSAVVDIMDEFYKQGNHPAYVTIETNGTQPVRRTFVEYFGDGASTGSMEEFEGKFGLRGGRELFWSCSPKLYISGESWEDAIKPDVVGRYNEISPVGQLKYVCDGSDRCWDEIEKATDLYRNEGVDWPVWVMPVGADDSEQHRNAARVSDGAIERGYNVAARVHVYVYGNVIGR